MEKTILLIEDDKMILSSLTEALQLKNYTVFQSKSVKEAKAVLEKQEIVLIILDINLPDGNGITLCKELRAKYSIPIIFLTAYNDEETIVAGLNAGGDDYICKPFSIKELYARINCILRRISDDKIIISGDLQIDLLNYKVYKNNQEIILSAIGYQILFLLVSAKGRVITRNQLLDFIESKTGNFIEDNTLSVHIKRLREKLGVYQGKAYIETIRGIGYRWNKE
ncbi:MAG: response regulator transcription factor [Thomasclavelia sp.]